MQTKFVNGQQPSRRNIPRNRKSCSSLGFLCGTVLLGAVTGCVSYVDQPRGGVVYAEPAPVYAQPAPVYAEPTPMYADPGYVYYPGYQVYYSGHTHQYVYRDGHAWVSRSAPPRVSAEVLFASPSVRMDFHDSPSIHHATVVRQYPRNWAPPKSNHSHNDDRDHGNRKDHD